MARKNGDMRTYFNINSSLADDPQLGQRINRPVIKSLTCFLAAVALIPIELKAEVLPTSFINGKKPPGRVAELVDTQKLVDEIRPDGMQQLVLKGTRLPGTRVAIHVHEYSGFTCIFEGLITDFVEGKKDATYGPGDCYYMPANTPMSAANLGEEPVVLIDSFVVPPGKPVIRKIEPGFN